MPNGNEKGALDAPWLPGGYTSGNIPELIIDSPAYPSKGIKSIKLKALIK